MTTSLAFPDDTFRHPSERSYDLVRKFQRPIFEAEFYYDREDTWVLGYLFDELADGSKVKQGDTITLEDAEKVLHEKVRKMWIKKVRTYINFELEHGKITLIKTSNA